MTDDPKRLGNVLEQFVRRGQAAQLTVDLQLRHERFSDAQLAKLFVRRLYVVADQIGVLAGNDPILQRASAVLQKELWELADEIEERLGR